MASSTGRPHVYLNYACSADGKISSVARDEVGFGSPRDKDRMDRLRADADAVLIGASTLRVEDPDLRVRAPARRRKRLQRGQSEQPLRAVVSRSLDLPAGARFFARGDSPPLVLTAGEPPAERLRQLDGKAEVLGVGADDVDLKRALGTLWERGVRRLLVEGGGTLNAALFAADLVDEVFLTVCPLVLGGDTAPTPVDGPGLASGARPRLRLDESYQGGDEVFCRYSVIRHGETGAV